MIDNTLKERHRIYAKHNFGWSKKLKIENCCTQKHRKTMVIGDNRYQHANKKSAS